MKNEKIKVGQTVWIKSARGFGREGIEEKIVTKVGRIYFEVERCGRFNIETLKHDNGDYSPAYKVYLDKGEYELSQEMSQLSSKIRSFMTAGYGEIKLPIEKLRQIAALIE